MEQLWLVGIVDEVAVQVELQESVREEVMRVMATAILAVYHAGSEVHNKHKEATKTPKAEDAGSTPSPFYSKDRT